MFGRWLQWNKGRQQGGYWKMLLATSPWPIPFDAYLLKFEQGAVIAEHTDPVKTGRHYRLNIVLKAAQEGGEFVCTSPIYSNSRIKFFRPDACAHSVSEVRRGSRWVVSIGWIRR
ncbi:MAG: 2OG-Fe(II) oxygenase [Pseudomonadota bacterium]